MAERMVNFGGSIAKIKNGYAYLKENAVYVGKPSARFSFGPKGGFAGTFTFWKAVYEELGDFKFRKYKEFKGYDYPANWFENRASQIFKD